MGEFNKYYQKFIKMVENSLSEFTDKKNLHCPMLMKETKHLFCEHLHRISIRALIFEMNLSSQCGELKGITDKEKYQSFVSDCLLNEQWLREFYEEYPELYRNMVQTVQNQTDNLIQMINRFEQDKGFLNARYFKEKPCTYIQKIGGGSSDCHRGGKKVYFLYLDNGEVIVYKPRSLACDEWYSGFVSWVSNEIGIDYKWNWICGRGEYGWCEWVSVKSCQTEEQLERYYMRNGVLLAVSYLLGSGDIHYENLIAHGETPIIIDLEMGLGCRKNDGKKKTEIIHQDSVLRTGLLPLYAWNEEGEGVNVGAVNGGGEQLVPIEMPVIADAGTVKMHIEYRQPYMQEGKNLAKLGTKFIEPAYFISQIQEGFEKTYRYFVLYRDEIWRRLQTAADIQVRYLTNETQIYMMLLNASYLPECMQKMEKRVEILQHVKNGRVKSDVWNWIAEQEIREMRDGDIPYFFYRIGERTLHSGTGELLQEYFDETALETIRKRLFGMSDDNLRQQKRFIRTSLMMGKKMVEKAQWQESLPDNLSASDMKVMGLCAAEKIGDLLIEGAVISEDKKEAGWINFMAAGYRERSYLVRPTSVNLYDGLAGIALFMTKLALCSEKEKYRNWAEQLVQQIFDYTDKLGNEGVSEYEKHTTGAFTGEASLAYAYQLLYGISKEERFLEKMEKQCLFLQKLLPYDKVYDVLGGNAGAVLVLLNAYEMTHQEKYLLWAKEAGEYLAASAAKYSFGMGWINSVSDKALTGFAHGASGIMLALVRLGHYTGIKKYDDLAYQAFRYEKHYYDAGNRDWIDLRYPKEYALKQSVSRPLKGNKCSHGSLRVWCHGRGGILMAEKLALHYVTEDWRQELQEMIFEADQDADINSYCDGYSLCHGRFGMAALLAEKEVTDKKPYLLSELIRGLYASCSRLEDILPVQERENFGLMSGLTGIGYGCLSDCDEIKKLLEVRF